MSYRPEEARNHECQDVDVECGVCVSQTARSVAELTPGLDLEGVRDVFRMMYPESACRRQAVRFEREYMTVVPRKVTRIFAA
ncbi:MAG: hypothetical protein SFV54_24000 [Bryobacteraceae bacterium]|nr:hypothetical protein [Bryobacteraceae bacterium]